MRHGRGIWNIQLFYEDVVELIDHNGKSSLLLVRLPIPDSMPQNFDLHLPKEIRKMPPLYEYKIRREQSRGSQIAKVKRAHISEPKHSSVTGTSAEERAILINEKQT